MENHKRMKSIITLSVFVFLSATFFGQTKDPKAKAILDQALEKYKTYKSFEAVIKYVKHIPELEDETYSAEVKFQDTKMYAKTSDGREIFNDGKNLYMYYQDGNEVNIYTSDPEENEDFNIENYLKDFDKKYKYVHMGNVSIKGVACDFIELAPDLPLEELQRQSISKVKVYLNSSTHEVVSWLVIERTGINYNILIESFKPNKVFESSEFLFDKSKYPGVEVIDMRE